MLYLIHIIAAILVIALAARLAACLFSQKSRDAFGKHPYWHFAWILFAGFFIWDMSGMSSGHGSMDVPVFITPREQILKLEYTIYLRIAPSKQEVFPTSPKSKQWREVGQKNGVYVIPIPTSSFGFGRISQEIYYHAPAVGVRVTFVNGMSCTVKVPLATYPRKNAIDIDCSSFLKADPVPFPTGRPTQTPSSAS
ncbi:MAG: hypothetical protein ACOYM3_18755 [Terrimicrobiaceae bacterium]